MIARLGGTALDAAAAWRRRGFERVWRQPMIVQECSLLTAVAAARNTEFGLAHDFDRVRSIDDYRARVPLRDYLDLKRWLDSVAAGDAGVTWPGRAPYCVKTSGTTAGDKAIPVTEAAFRSHRRGGWDALLMAAERVGGAALLLSAPAGWFCRSLLASPPLVWIGLISYPLYLWHWPLLSYLAIVRNGVPNFVEIWATVLIAVVLSWLTFRFVEIPLRREQNVAPRLSFGLITVGMVGIVTAIASGFGFRFPPEIRDIAQLAPQNNAGFRDKCFLDAPGSQFNSNCIEQGDEPLMLLWGDSTAAALYPGLKNAQVTVPFRLARFTASGCAPILAAGSNARCDAANDIVFGLIRSSHPEIVLLHAWWDGNKDLDKLRETIGQLKALNIRRIVILGPVPVWKRTLPHSLVNFYRLRHAIADRITAGMSGPQGDERMEAFSKAAGVEYISAWHALCNSEGCMTRVGPAANDVITTDKVHLSDAGSNFLIDGIRRSLFPLH